MKSMKTAHKMSAWDFSLHGVSQIQREFNKIMKEKKNQMCMKKIFLSVIVFFLSLFLWNHKSVTDSTLCATNCFVKSFSS
jgi:hypothetical protein